ncbi:cytochrome P450 2F2-like [Liolophura sinensis]|uniref:cytochrome P450 2F2-like n=1 Tax=Liolophura sinensis TaxID=3198878 RepID=UPI003158B41F
MILDILSANLTTVLIFVIAFLLVWRTLRRPAGNLPPGPWPLPIFGNLLSLGGADSRKSLEALREKYGDVYTLYIGKHPSVYVHGYENVKEVLVTRGDDFVDRPQSLKLVQEAEGKGILFTSGKVWQEQRRFSIQALKDFGFGKHDLQVKIQEEVEVLVNRISDLQGQPFDLHDLIHISVSNVICSVVFGTRFEHDDNEFKTYVDMLDENFRLTETAILGLLIPFSYLLPGDLFHMKRLEENKHILKSFITNLIQAHKESFDPNNRRDFIDAYMREARERQQHDPETTLSEDQLGAVISDLFAAGTESTSTVIRWAALLMLKYPDVQGRVRREIDSVVGGRLPSLADRQHLPFTEATMMEVLRYTDIAMAGHATVRDLTFHGYNIPKGTTVMPCFHCALHDRNYWKHPDIFNPDRFLDDWGHFRKPESFIPFSAGRRVCLGESLARMELYLFFSAILQRFELRLPDGAGEPDLTPVIGITRMPKRFEMIAKLRH